jgi:hypothetical protein
MTSAVHLGLKAFNTNRAAEAVILIMTYIDLLHCPDTGHACFLVLVHMLWLPHCRWDFPHPPGLLLVAIHQVLALQHQYPTGDPCSTAAKGKVGQHGPRRS